MRPIRRRRVAVGTVIADCPPHRTVRALQRIRLPPWRICEKDYSSHTAQALGHPCPARCRVGVGLNDVLLGPRPFLPSLRRDTMARSDSSRACMSAVRLWAFADRPRSLSGRGAPEVSRFSCMLFLSVRRFFDAGPSDRSRLSRISRCAFLHQEQSRRPDFRFSKLNHPAHRYPYLRFERHLAMPPPRLRAKMESLSPFL